MQHKLPEDFIAAELKIFLNPPMCAHHRKATCALCDAMASDFSVHDKKAYFHLLENMSLQFNNGKPELHAKFTYTSDPKVNVLAENSNFEPSLKAAISNFNRLKKTGQ